jgi:hypothetical protein
VSSDLLNTSELQSTGAETDVVCVSCVRERTGQRRAGRRSRWESRRTSEKIRRSRSGDSSFGAVKARQIGEGFSDDDGRVRSAVYCRPSSRNRVDLGRIAFVCVGVADPGVLRRNGVSGFGSGGELKTTLNGGVDEAAAVLRWPAGGGIGDGWSMMLSALQEGGRTDRRDIQGRTSYLRRESTVSLIREEEGKKRRLARGGSRRRGRARKRHHHSREHE